MFANEKNEEVEDHYGFGTVEVKRFFQWILGCTYAKKTLRTRITEMFHFADAPHIIVYEKSEERPWYWMVGIIIAVLFFVLSLYYTVEAGFRAIRKFMKAVLREPVQSTVSTPRCLSPTTSSSKKCSPQTPKTPEVVRQKVAMNEPVNCVFIRPAHLKVAPPAPTLTSEEDCNVDPDQVLMNKKETTEKDSLKEKMEKKKSPPSKRLEEVEFDASTNFNVIPTMVPSPQVRTNSTQTSHRKSSGSDASGIALSALSELDQVNEWIVKQIAGCKALEPEERTDAGVCEAEILSEPSMDSHVVSDDLMAIISKLINEQLDETSLVGGSSDENLSEMSSIVSSLIEIVPSYTETFVTEPDASEVEHFAKQTTGEEEDADIIVDDSPVLTDSDNECSGSILVKGGTQKVLFRWTDEQPSTVDNVTLTGSFFGWKMNLPMKRCDEKTFEVWLELPNGMHDYLISVLRFD
ncbi:hypothetical protein CAEBREN_28852 [Caenorhabditis brenneri]|uniref:AMP-activated protein kinase glycogen-binding domain-containing protein n=1 Tax=Caenorhabditis brenneri TaxID=135651 RepID=G0NMN4_CAEBE|nr:hypothetical protein CAEBREN_28852 [Caenorhabditis brenneri]